MALRTNGKIGLATADHRLRTLNPKMVLAVVLMTVMGLLWVRVLTRSGGPATAEAAGLTDVRSESSPAPAPVRVLPSPLPVIAGRNDTLTRDFFSPVNWPGFGQTDLPAQRPAGLSAQDDVQQRRLQYVASLGKTLMLEAIIQAAGSAPARVCIDGKVLTQGQSLVVKNNAETYELAVSEIGDEQVVLTCDRQCIVLKMPPSERVD